MMAELQPQIDEVNYIAIMLARNIRMKAFYKQEPNGFVVPFVIVNNMETGARYHWNLETFQNRLTLFRLMAADFYDDGILQSFPDRQKDPFWDPNEED